MPRDVQYDQESTIEVQWAKQGELVVVSVKGQIHQFSDEDDLTQFISSLRRARKQAFQ